MAVISPAPQPTIPFTIAAAAACLVDWPQRPSGNDACTVLLWMSVHSVTGGIRELQGALTATNLASLHVH